MRLIKAEDVCEMLDIIADSKAITTKHGTIAFAKIALDEIPVIDPESLRPQSEWEHFTRRENGQDVCYVRCKRCRKERGFDYGLNYCQNCGAKMNGGDSR